MPRRVDSHVDVPAPKDRRGRASCPECHAQLQDVQKHKRIVEDLIPQKRLVICYHTQSGYCAGCRKRVESRHPDQPPLPAGAEIHQPQLGINSLATVALLRLRYRLPYRQIKQLFRDLPGMSISAGGLARQIQRMASWLDSQYDRLKVLIRASPCVHMDETSWRIDGQNHWLWTMLSNQATVYHVDKSRGQQVTGSLLGENFTGTLVSDFYSAYAQVACPKQKCLVHLLRELKTTREKSPAFAGGAFNRRLSRLVGQMLLLKKSKAKLAANAYETKVRKLERRLLELEQGCWKETHAKRLAKRLRGHNGELTTFLRNDEVEGDNNAAERALRPVVVLRKITGGSRSAAGARATAVLQSILRTALQQKCPLFQTIKTLLAAHWAGENPALLTDIFRNMA
jgi:transposase